MILDLEKSHKFFRYFGENIVQFIDDVCSGLAKEMMIDIIQFSQYLQDYFDYSVKEHGTIDDFITLRFGEEALELIQELQ